MIAILPQPLMLLILMNLLNQTRIWFSLGLNYLLFDLHLQAIHGANCKNLLWSVKFQWMIINKIRRIYSQDLCKKWTFVLGVSQEKLFGMCRIDECLNIHATFLHFFSKYKTETANRGQRQLLENRWILCNINKFDNSAHTR